MEKTYLENFEEIVYDDDIIMVVFKSPTIKTFNIIVNRRKKVGSLVRFLYEELHICHNIHDLVDQNSRILKIDDEILKYCERGGVLKLDIKYNKRKINNCENSDFHEIIDKNDFIESKKDNSMVEKSPEKNNEILDQTYSRNSVASNEERINKIKKSKKSKKSKKKKKKKKKRKKSNCENVNK